jgi:hypothetical protein
LFKVQRKLFDWIGSLEIMNLRIATTRRVTWRHRFLEIARRFEAVEPRVSAASASGLRPRAKMAGFATLRRNRAG